MEAEQHLARRAAVHKDERRAGLRAIVRDEELPVNFQAVLAAEDDLLRLDQLR
jgi:hypothetical protein